LICKRSLFSLKRALLYFYTSILRLSLSLYLCMYITSVQYNTNRAHVCGVKKKKHTHKFFYFFLELANESPPTTKDKETTTKRRPLPEEKEKEGHASKITFFSQMHRTRLPSLLPQKICTCAR
jgi:hypothetical protein